MRRDDNTGVPHTCPLINQVIDFVRNIPIESDIDQEVLDFNREKAEIIETLEKIRAHNSDLRDYGVIKNSEREEFEADVERLQEKINELESELQEKEAEIADLECKIEEFQD